MEKSSVTVDVYKCARCGSEHPQLKFTAFTIPAIVHGTNVTYTHFAMCPVCNEPILIRSLNSTSDDET